MANVKTEARVHPEFSKRLLIADYAIFVVMLVAFFYLAMLGADVSSMAMVLTGWAVQLGVSQGFYYWKARSENRIKIPIKVIESLPPRIRKELDMTQVVCSIIQSE